MEKDLGLLHFLHRVKVCQRMGQGEYHLQFARVSDLKKMKGIDLYCLVFQSSKSCNPIGLSLENVRRMENTIIRNEHDKS